MTRTISVSYTSEITAADVSNSGYLYEIDESMLAEAISEQTAPQVTDASIEDYLINNDVDLTSITEQL